MRVLRRRKVVPRPLPPWPQRGHLWSPLMTTAASGTSVLCTPAGNKDSVFFPKSWIRVFLILLPHQKIGNYWLLCGRSFTSLRTNPEYMATSFLYIVVSYVSFASTEPVILAVLFFFYNYAFQFVLFYSFQKCSSRNYYIMISCLSSFR